MRIAIMGLLGIIGGLVVWAIGVAGGWPLDFVSLILFILLIIGSAFAMASGEKRPAAILAAMSLGIMGGFMGTLFVASLLLWGWEWEVTWENLAGGSLYAVMGIGGGVLALIKPGVAGTLMVVTGIVGFIGADTFDLPPLWASMLGGFLLVTGGALALVGRERHPAIKIAALALGVLAGCMGAKAAYTAIGGVIPAELVIWGFL